MNQGYQPLVSDYQLERYLLREMRPEELAFVEREIAADPAVTKRLEALQRSNEELCRRFPPEWMVGQIELKRQKMGQGQKKQRSGYRLWAVPVLAIILVVVGVPALFEQNHRAPQTRIKGGEEDHRLMIFRKASDGEERLLDGALAQKGDLVQIVYRSGGLSYGAILSIDGHGTVTQHLPVDEKRAVLLAAKDTLDYAYKLDDAPNWERFVFVAADSRFDLSAIVEQLTARGTLGSTDEMRVFEFTLNKPSTP